MSIKRHPHLLEGLILATTMLAGCSGGLPESPAVSPPVEPSPTPQPGVTTTVASTAPMDESLLAPSDDAPQIIDAAFRGDREWLNQLLEQGGHPDAKDELGWTPLHWAAWQGNTQMVSDLIRAGADVEARTQGWKDPFADPSDYPSPLWGPGFFTQARPLHFAAFWGRSAIVQSLLEHGSDPNAGNADGNPPLFLAAYEGQKEAVELLIAAGADLDATNNRDLTVLEFIADTEDQGIRELVNPASGLPGRIAFYSRELRGICIIPANGSENCDVRITSNWSADPALSRDGGWVAFTMGDNETGYDIYASHIDGSDYRALTSGRKHRWDYPAWSNDGRKIAFHIGIGGSEPHHDIGILRLKSGSMWPDSQSVMVPTYEEMLCHINDAMNMTWSPDNRKIAFSGYCFEEGQRRETSQYGIYVIEADGHPVTRLTDRKDWYPSWSPDGRQIVFVSRVRGSDSLFIMNSDGSDIRSLTTMTASSPDWSPDGKWVVFASKGGLYVVPADSSADPIMIRIGEIDAMQPSWGP